MTYVGKGAAYTETRVLSSSPKQLVPLLYEHLLVNLKRASSQIRAGEIEAKCESTERASAILYELMGTLDFDTEGDLASRLASLYTFFLKEIAEASRKLDAERLSPLIEMVASLHGSWAEAVKTVSAQRTPSPTPGR